MSFFPLALQYSVKVLQKCVGTISILIYLQHAVGVSQTRPNAEHLHTFFWRIFSRVFQA